MTGSPGAPAEGGVLPLPVSIRREDVLRLLGYPERRRPANRIEALVDDTLEEARGLVSPRGAFVHHPVERAGDLGLQAMEATALVVGLVTIGDALERRAGSLVEQGHPTRALVLDAAGSAAAEEAADRLGAMVAAEPTPSPASAVPISCRISPGYGAWSIRSQAPLFAALPHRELGVSLLPSMLMSPRKSISFAMWLGSDRRPLAGLSGCARCELVRCQYRRARDQEAYR